MRFVIKLLCIALLGLFAEVGFDSAPTVTRFPFSKSHGPFDESVYRQYQSSATCYHQSTRLSQWLITAVFNIDFPNAC